MNKSVVIVGASGHGKVVADIVLKNKDNIVGFLDDNTELEESFAGFPVLGTTDQYQKYSDACFVIAIGNAAVREKLVNELKNVSWYTAIHPTAVISELDANIGEGTVIMANPCFIKPKDGSSKAVASILGSELYAEKLWKYFEQGLH